MKHVLELNSVYEAVGVISPVRAIIKLHKGKARVELPLDPPEFLHTSMHEFPIPSIIVQTTPYIDVRRRRAGSAKQRLRIFIRDKFRCQYCGKRFQPHLLTLDHILPQSRDGKDEAENLVAACKPCNSRKGNRTPEEARMPLLSTPSALRYGLERALLIHHAENRVEWHDYLYIDQRRIA